MSNPTRNTLVHIIIKRDLFKPITALPKIEEKVLVRARFCSSFKYWNAEIYLSSMKNSAYFEIAAMDLMPPISSISSPNLFFSRN